MTPAEQRIADYLGANAHRYVSAWDISHAAGIKDDRCVRVMIHRLRYVRHFAIESCVGRVGGYRLLGFGVKSSPKGQSHVRPRVSGHSERMAQRMATQAFADEAGALASELNRIATKYGRKPSTVAKIAVARAGA